MVAIVNYTVCKQGVVCLVLPDIHTYGGNSKLHCVQARCSVPSVARQHTYGGNSKLHCVQARCSVPSVARHTYIWWQ